MKSFHYSVDCPRILLAQPTRRSGWGEGVSGSRRSEGRSGSGLEVSREDPGILGSAPLLEAAVQPIDDLRHGRRTGLFRRRSGRTSLDDDPLGVVAVEPHDDARQTELQHAASIRPLGVGVGLGDAELAVLRLDPCGLDVFASFGAILAGSSQNPLPRVVEFDLDVEGRVVLLLGVWRDETLAVELHRDELVSPVDVRAGQRRLVWLRFQSAPMLVVLMWHGSEF